MSLAAARRRSVLERTDSPALAPSAAWVLVAGLTLIAFALRVSQIDQSLLGDEVFTYQDIYRHSFGTVLTTVQTGGENSPPLYFVLAWLSAQLGDPTVWIRLPSVVLGAATVPVVFALGWETIGTVGALIGAAIFAITPFTVYYGTEARPYATMTFFVAVSTLALLRAVKGKSRWWWLVYVVATVAAAYSHYTCVFVLFAQACWSLWACRDRIREPLAANLIAALLYLPWLPHLRGKALAVIGALYPLGVHRVLTDLLRPIPGHPSAPLSAIPTIPGLVAVAVCAMLGMAFMARKMRAPRARLPPHLPLLIALTLASPVGLLLYSVLDTDLWLPRGLSASIPAAALVLGAFLAAPPRRLVLATVTIVLAVMAAGTARSFDTTYARPPFRVMAGYLDDSAGPHDPVLIMSLVGQPAITAEWHKPHLLVNALGPMWADVPPRGTAYLVLDDAIARDKHLGTPEHRGFELVARRHYVGGGFPTAILIYRRG